MAQISSKTQLKFEPNMSVIADATGTTTNKNAWGARLGKIALWNEKTAFVQYMVRLNQTSTAGEAVIRLTDTVNTYFQKTLDLSSGEVEFHGRTETNLQGVEGQANLRLQVEITTAADASTTLVVDGVLDIESPLIVVGC